MLKNRQLRVTLPFVIFLPMVVASFAVLIGWAMEHVEAKSPMLGLISMMSQVPDAPPPPLTTTHLWFLYNLTFFISSQHFAQNTSHSIGRDTSLNIHCCSSSWGQCF